MDAKSICIYPVTPVIGAEILGIDLDKPLDEDTFQIIHEALITYQVIFFRDQDISVEAHKKFGSLFGELDIHPNDPGLEGHPEVMIIHADENSKRIAGETWHSDVSCSKTPPLGSILRLYEVPETGGDTVFSSMYEAYNTLSDPMKLFLENLTAHHDGGPYYRSVNTRIGRDDGGRTYPTAEHPVIRTHPVSGKKALYVNSMFTQHIIGLPKAESDAVLEFLFEHVQNPAFQCRFKWEKNSIAFWDNRSAQHYAIWDYFPNIRSGYRVTVIGDQPK